jgi:hypothetical protein
MDESMQELQRPLAVGMALWGAFFALLLAGAGLYAGVVRDFDIVALLRDYGDVAG